MLTHDAKPWELGQKDDSALLRLLIRNAFGAISVLTNLHFKLPPLWKKGQKQVFGLIDFESFGSH